MHQRLMHDVRKLAHTFKEGDLLFSFAYRDTNNMANHLARWAVRVLTKREDHLIFEHRPFCLLPMILYPIYTIVCLGHRSFCPSPLLSSNLYVKAIRPLSRPAIPRPSLFLNQMYIASSKLMYIFIFEAMRG